MRLWKWASGLTALALFATAATVQAERVPSTRVPSPPPATGPRPDITVPYTTDGNSTLIAGQFVSPRIYNSPQVDDPRNPGVRPVFNLIFYGSRLGFGDFSNGAATRPPGPPLGPPLVPR